MLKVISYGLKPTKWVGSWILQVNLKEIFKKSIIKQTSFFSGYCHSSSVSASLENLCMSIESDSPLFFIFRTTSRDKNVLLQKDTEACPFRNIEYAFSYSTRGGAKVHVEINYEGAFLLLLMLLQFHEIFIRYLCDNTLRTKKVDFIFLLKHLKLSAFDLINSYLSFLSKNNSKSFLSFLLTFLLATNGCLFSARCF